MKAYAKLQELENNLLGQAAGRGGIAGKDVLKQCFYFYNVHLCQGVHQYFFILDVQGIADFGQGGRAGRGSGKRLLFQAAGREAENAGQSRNIRENIARLIHGGKAEYLLYIRNNKAHGAGNTGQNFTCAGFIIMEQDNKLSVFHVGNKSIM